MNKIDTRLLREIADLEGTPKGAYNIRKNGQLESRSNTANIEIVSKTDKSGITSNQAGTKNQSVHFPSSSPDRAGRAGLAFSYDVVIVCCGITTPVKPPNDGVHTFTWGELQGAYWRSTTARRGTGERIMNPRQWSTWRRGSPSTGHHPAGVDSTKRYTSGGEGRGGSGDNETLTGKRASPRWM
ncbi:MAG: hypothetical protein ACLS43_06350 [Evtepia gabavorous]